MHPFKYLAKKAKTLSELVFLNRSDKVFVSYAKKKFTKVPAEDEGEILLDQMFNSLHIWQNAHLINFFQKNTNQRWLRFTLSL